MTYFADQDALIDALVHAAGLGRVWVDEAANGADNDGGQIVRQARDHLEIIDAALAKAKRAQGWTRFLLSDVSKEAAP